MRAVIPYRCAHLILNRTAAALDKDDEWRLQRTSVFPGLAHTASSSAPWRRTGRAKSIPLLFRRRRESFVLDTGASNEISASHTYLAMIFPFMTTCSIRL